MNDWRWNASAGSELEPKRKLPKKTIIKMETPY
jgi:hypothetical protein